ncbi:MAG: biotin/lipoyl-binding protein [Rhodospirillales bacterium]
MQTAIRSGLLTLLVSFGGLGSWAALAPLDGAVVGSGTLVVHGNRKTVQHREGGIVESLAVAEGDHVLQGQVLIRLDGTQAKANLAVHDAALAGDLALTARDLAEIAGADHIDFPTTLLSSDIASAAVMGRETTVFRNHRALLHEQLAVIDQRIVQAHRQAEGSQAQYQAAIHGLGLAAQELQAFTILTQSGLASRTHVLELGRGVDQLRGDVGQLQSDIARHTAEAAELGRRETPPAGRRPGRCDARTSRSPAACQRRAAAHRGRSRHAQSSRHPRTRQRRGRRSNGVHEGRCHRTPANRSWTSYRRIKP